MKTFRIYHFGFLILAAALAGCDVQPAPPVVAPVVTVGFADSFRIVSFNAHTYVVVYERGSQGSAPAITHDPDCVCLRKSSALEHGGAQ